jgi:hypothetical protein
MPPTTALRIRCPICGEPERIPHSAVGRRAQCNKCRSMFRIAAPGTQLATPAPPARVITPPPLPVMSYAPASYPPAGLARHEAAKAPPATVRKRALIGLCVGLCLVIGGIVITAVSYGSASDSGGTYVVLWGPVVFGAGMTLRSMYRLMSGSE